MESVGLLNSGFESEAPGILVPHEVATRLGFLPTLPAGASLRDFETAGGSVRMYLLTQAVRVRVICDDKQSDPASCDLTISEVEREVILSDTLIDALSISLESPGSGHWKFYGEEAKRTSLAPQYW